MKLQNKYIAAISFGLLMGATSYGASQSIIFGQPSDISTSRVYLQLMSLNQEAEKQYNAARDLIAALPADRDLNVPGALENGVSENPLAGFPDMPPVFACLEFYFPYNKILRALLDSRRVAVDLVHGGITALFKALIRKDDDYSRYNDNARNCAAKMLIDDGASLFAPCTVSIADFFKIDGHPGLYRFDGPYFADYRFNDERDVATPFELALQTFMYMTKTRIIDYGSYEEPRYAADVIFFRQLLKKGLDMCTFESAPEGGFRVYEIDGHNNAGTILNNKPCYKIIQPVVDFPGGLPPLAITIEAYNNIMGILPLPMIWTAF